MLKKEAFNHKFVQNSKCEYFPCHKMDDKEKFNCLFCYCPLYMMGEECGGNFKYTEHGIKDCSQCSLPHIKDVGYDHIRGKMKTVINMVKDKHLKNKK
nr:cysteine-rich small domain-containing protein [uncultured Ilyobacter sp.]